MMVPAKWLSQRFRVVNGGGDFQRLQILQMEAFHDMHLFAVARSPAHAKRGVLGETDGIHNQGIAFPMSN